MSAAAGNNQAGFGTDSSEYDALDFHIRQVLSEANFVKAVKVVACSNANGVSAIGTVDVVPVVSGVDGQGNATKHGQLNGLPYARVQSGGNAIIMDPTVGDVGIAVFADRDSSAVSGSGAQVAPGSYRKNDWGDGFYLFAAYGASAPTQYVRFSTAGISAVSSSAITLSAGGHTLLINSAGIALDGKLFAPHTHTGVEAGSGTTGPVA